MGLTEEERRRTMPDRGNEDTVFADGSPTQFSVGRTTKKQPFVEVETDILENVPQDQWIDTVKQNLKEKFPDGIIVGKNKILIDDQSRKEMTYSRYTQWLYYNEPDIRKDKFKATDHADEIIMATTDWKNEGLQHPRKDKIVDFARGNVLLRVGNSDYSAEVVVGTRKNGQMILYDILNMQRSSFTKKEIDTAKSTNPSPGAARNTVAISDISVPDQKTKVNIQNSFSPNTASDSDTDTEATSALRDSITGKAREYMERAERVLMEKVGKALSISSRTKEGRGFLQEISHALSEEYLREGRVAEEVRDRLFEAAYV